MQDVNMPAPDLVDNFGTKWWLDKGASNYASSPNRKGIKLGAEVWLIEELNGKRAFVLVQNQQVKFEHSSLQAVGEYIDKVKETGKW